MWIAISGLVLGAGTGLLGVHAKLLSRSGLICVFFTIFLTFLLNGWVWGALLLSFYISAGLILRYRAGYKAQLAEWSARGLYHRWDQIIARIGWGVVLLALQRLAPSQTGVFVAFVGTLATASADTWATEIGLLSTKEPRLLISGRRVPANTPGAVSMLGVLASLAGSWLMGFAGLLLGVLLAYIENLPWDRTLFWLPLAATLGGAAGSLVDSLLGAAAQGLYYCEYCKRESENPIHHCGRQAEQIRGWSWLTSEGIDLVSSAVGAAVALGAVAGLARAIVWW